MKRRVVVTGMGCITPIGNSVSEFYNNLIMGKHGIDQITLFDASASKAKLAAEVKGFNDLEHFDRKTSKRLDRSVKFGIVAGKQAIEDSKLELEKIDKYRFGVIVGTGVGGIETYFTETKNYLDKGPSYVNPLLVPKFIPNMTSGHLSIEFGAKGNVSTIITACAAATHSIGEGFRLIADGYQDVMLCGGTEACINPVMQSGFINMNAHSLSSNKDKASRPFDSERDGFVLGEGSGFLVLETLESALSRGAHIYSEIVGYGFTADAYHVTSPDPSGEGIIRCMENAVYEAGISIDDINYINTHGTGTPLNDEIESAAIEKLYARSDKKAYVNSTKSMIGHLLGAAGAVEAIAAIKQLENGILHPSIGIENIDNACNVNVVTEKIEGLDMDYVLSNSFGFGGHNGSLVFKRYRGEEKC